MTERAEVVVVGAGFAGLRAARDLAAAGVPTVVLEARPRLGGRTYTTPYRDADVAVELGGSFFLGEHREVRAELRRYAVGERRWDPARRFRWHTDGVLREGLPVAAGEWGELERVLRRLAADVDDYAAGTNADLASLSLGDYLRQLGTTTAVRDFLFGWSVTSVGAPEEQGAVADGLSGLADHGGLLAYAGILERTPVPGWSTLAESMADSATLDLRLGQAVRRVTQADDGLRVSATGGDIVAGRVVVALPINVLPSVALDCDVPPGVLEVAGANTGAAVKVVFRARGIPDGSWGVGRGRGLGQLVWDRPDEDDPDLTWMVGFGARHPGVDLDDAGQLERAVQAFFPDATVADSMWHDWNADPWSLGTWRTARPGHRPQHPPRSGAASPVQFAGSDIAERAQGWVEGALESGARAAGNLLAQLGVGGSRAGATGGGGP